MKKTIVIIGQMWFMIFLFCQIGIAQTPKFQKNKLILDELNTSKLNQLKSENLSDTLLFKKGFKLYKADEFKSKINLNIDNIKKFTLKEINDRNSNCGNLPLQSPLFFQKNAGQTDNSFKYILQNVGSAVGFYDKGLTAVVQKGLLESEISGKASGIKGNKIVMNFKGSSGTLEARKQIDGIVRSCKGNNKEKWLNNIPCFNYLINDNLYPGIKLAYQAKLGRLEYQFLLEPTANIKNIKISVEGSEKLYIDKNGNLVILTSGGAVVQTRPKFYDQLNDTRTEIKGAFVLFSKNEYGFIVSNHNKNAKMIIDPEIVFTSYFGGSANDAMLGADDGANDFIGRGFDTKIGPDGDIFVIGKTFSADFPVTNSTTLSGSGDIFVMRIDPTQPVGSNIVYVTFIGGSNDENARSIEAMADGSSFITGWSASNDFPTSTGVVQPTRERSGAYVAKLTPDGDFELGTFIGKARSNHPNSIVFNKRASDNQGFIYVGGSSQQFSGSDATQGSFQNTFAGGGFDGFITKLNLSLTNYEYFTYLGGAGRDVIMDIDVVDGFAFVTGMTASTDFPTNDIAFQQQHTEQANSCNGSISNRACAEVFVTRLNREGNATVYSTFIGESGREDYARGIAVNSNRQAYITGASASITDNSTNIFVAKLEAGGENVLWKTNIAGIGKDHGEELVVDQFDRAHITGTISVDGRSTGFDANTFNGGRSDIFYCRLSDDGSNEFFTYLGGNGEDRGFAIATSGNSLENFCATIVGSTVSDNIETINPLSGGETRKGNADLLIFTVCNLTPDITASGFIKSGPDAVRRGDNISYIITVINGGDVAAPVVITDNVPSLINVTGVSGTGCSRSGNNITCSLQAQPGATTIVVTGTVISSANPNTCVNTSVTNTATIQVGSRRFSSSKTTQILCEPPLCGNGRLDPGEECDGTPGCRSNCTRRICGDGILDAGEECDNGRSNCVNCRIILQPGAECGSNITGNCPTGTTCRTQCFVIECEHGWWDGWGLFAGPNCGDMLCRKYKECVRN
jgi:hypothetical protein